MKPAKSSPFKERRSADLKSASQRALRPLIRLLLDRGIGFPEMSEVLRTIYFQVARDDFRLGSGKDTDSRLSLLTGIHRRDIKRLRAQIPTVGTKGKPKVSKSPASRDFSVAARVIALWTGTRAYQDRNGNPKPLYRFARKGGGQSFETLVREVNRDVRPRALLDEWLRRGAVMLDENGRVLLNLDAFMGQKDIEEKAFYLALNIHDHLATVVHNIMGKEPSYLERCVYYGMLTSQSVATLEALANKEGMKALQSINRRALQLRKRDSGKKDANKRMNFGLYFYGTDGRPVTDDDNSSDNT